MAIKILSVVKDEDEIQPLGLYMAKLVAVGFAAAIIKPVVESLYYTYLRTHEDKDTTPEEEPPTTV